MRSLCHAFFYAGKYIQRRGIITEEQRLIIRHNKTYTDLPEYFSGFISKENLDVIYNLSKRYGVEIGQMVDFLIDTAYEKKPDGAAVLCAIDLERIIRHQSPKNQIKTQFILAGALIKSIMDTNKYTLEEALNETT